MKWDQATIEPNVLMILGWEALQLLITEALKGHRVSWKIKNRNLLSHPDDLRKEAYLIRVA